MRSKDTILIVLFIVIFSSLNLYSQSKNFECGFTPSSNLYGVKPTRTNFSSDPYEAFPVLVVLVQFKDEDDLPRGGWPKNGEPTFLGNLIASIKNTNVNTPFWELYNPNTQMISSRWAEISRGAFHVISTQGAFSVVLPKTAKEYWYEANKNSDTCELAINRDIWASVIADGLTDWRDYDRYRFIGYNQFEYCEKGFGDGLVDMIYKIHKSVGAFTDSNNVSHTVLFNKAGYNKLNGINDQPISDVVDDINNISIDYQNGPYGSGLTLSFAGTIDEYLATLGHEHLHYMAFTLGHVTYSNCSYGIGIEYFYSPYDMIFNGYMSPTTATFGQTNTLGDYSSRNNGTGEILKVPISGEECFLLANRNKVSKWDRVMLGDTASLGQYNDNTEYGKGLYIYHIDPSGIRYPNSDISPQDMECADGYWEWEFQGRGTVNLVYDCFVSGNNWKIYKKKNVLYSNDPSLIFNPNPYGDEVSFRHTINYGTSDTTWPCWWGIGKQPISACYMGTDRIYTNDEDIYTKRGNMGDRWDAWKPEYNEVFSTYSSPSSLKWNNDTTGIFIWFNSSSGYTASINIYRATEYGGNQSLASILLATPPSRPMGLKVDRTDCINRFRYPILTWNHNMEPDMIQNSNKRYKIFRAFDALNTVPQSFTEIADVYINKDTPPSFIDYNVYGECNGIGQGDVNRIRYKIKAVDSTNWASVYSDFVATTSQYLNRGGDDGDGLVLNPEIPREFNLSQNYPNPFNPATKINFELPKQGFITLKVYDIIGREIKTLVNEVKQAGYYTVDFNGSSLASGVYFYRIQSGDFVSVKRMVLVK
ncbi:MAG: T9SS type A sorting domain-containing protein [Ignavibacteriota bacterium]